MILTIVLLLTVFSQAQSALSTVPNFQAADDDIVKLVELMRADDAEKPSWCDLEMNYQGVFRNGDDVAPNKLFTRVNEEVLKRNSFAKLLAVRKFFNPTTGVEETHTAAKAKAITDFYDAVWVSAPFQRLIKFFVAKKHPWAISPAMFKSSIRQIWFDEFSRARGRLDSSAFEHIFLGEEKNGEVSGMHNWAVMYELEKNPGEKFNYRGYIRKHYDVIGEINLIWRGVEKPTGSFFANSSPAFDFSVLTACFLTHRGKGDKCRILVDGCNIQIQAYDMVQNGKVFIGTAYPEIGRPSRDCDQLYNKRSMTMCKL